MNFIWMEGQEDDGEFPIPKIKDTCNYLRALKQTRHLFNTQDEDSLSITSMVMFLKVWHSTHS